MHDLPLLGSGVPSEVIALWTFQHSETGSADSLRAALRKFRGGRFVIALGSISEAGAMQAQTFGGAFVERADKCGS